MRINKIAEMLKGSNTLLDIGTDHAKVIIEALDKGYIKRAIATDINEGPLNHAKENIKNAGYSDLVTFIKTDGLKNIKEDYDVIAITGMGFQTIKEILNEKHKRPKFYVFGVQSEIIKFRKYLSETNYKIIDEQIVIDKKHYIFIKAVFEYEKLTEEDVILGPILKFKKEAIPFYKNKIKALNIKIKYTKGKDFVKLEKEKEFYLKAINNLQ